MNITFSAQQSYNGVKCVKVYADDALTVIELYRLPDATGSAAWHMRLAEYTSYGECWVKHPARYIDGPATLRVMKAKSREICEAVGDVSRLLELYDATEPPSWWPW